MSACRWLDARMGRVPDFIAAHWIGARRPRFRQARQGIAGIGNLRNDQVDDILLAALDRAIDHHKARRHDRTALLFQIAGPKQRIDDPGLVLDRDEDRIALATRTFAPSGTALTAAQSTTLRAAK